MGWTQTGRYHVGGTTTVGFSADGTYPLAISSSGRGLFDIATGEKVARDSQAHGPWDRETEADGIGPIEGQVIPVFGLFADLPQYILDELQGFDVNSHITDFIGAAISPDGQTLAIGYSDEIQIYKRT